MKTWNDLKFWKSETFDRIKKKLEFKDYATTANPSYQPNQTVMFRAFRETPFDKVKVVILGQDPYPTPGFATGLAFSCPPEAKNLPQSLTNIFKEYQKDLHYPRPTSGDLTPWAKEGVLLLNTSLTVAPWKPGSHSTLGWGELIEEALSALNEDSKGKVFILWGRHAQQYLPGLLPSLERQRHHVICSSHPSPLSAKKGFFGSRPFTTANGCLCRLGQEAVNWRLP